MMPLNIDDYIEEYFSDIDELLTSCSLISDGKLKLIYLDPSSAIKETILKKEINLFEIDQEFEILLQEIYDISTDEIKLGICNFCKKHILD